MTRTPYLETITLTPGLHKLQVQYRDAIFYGVGQLSLDAEAGTSYKLQTRVQGLSVQFWIVDPQGLRVTEIDSDQLHSGRKI